MYFIGYILFVFLWIRLSVSFFNWIGNLYLPKNCMLEKKPFLSVLIPARNEEMNIGNLLEELTFSEYGRWEVIVYDDLSTDATASIVEVFASQYPFIRLIRGTGPEKGWLGKNYACWQLAKAAKGEKFLFLDADVRVGKRLMERSIAYMQKEKVSFFSIFPRQLMPVFSTRLAVPLMNWILLALLPMPLIRLLPYPSLSAANGQFMLFDAATYKEIDPHKVFRHEPVEDMAIIREYKRKGVKVAALLGDEDIGCEMYRSLPEAINGFSKNVFQFFGGSVMITCLYAVVTTLTPFWLFMGNMPIEGWISIAAVMLIRVFISSASKQSAVLNILLMIPQQLVFWIIIFTALVQRKNKAIVWKERNIYESV